MTSASIPMRMCRRESLPAATIPCSADFQSAVSPNCIRPDAPTGLRAAECNPATQQNAILSHAGCGLVALHRILVLLFCLGASLAPARPALVEEARSVERGLNVGDGQVRYDLPFDPKHVSRIAFLSPTAEHPFFELVIPLGNWDEGESATVQKVSVNGVDSDSFYVFVDGFSHVQSAWITQKSKSATNVVLVTRSLWHNHESVAIEVEVSAVGDGGAARTVKKSFTAQAPASGGGPAGWRRYQSLVLFERAGLARDHEPVEFSLTVRAEDCADLERELRVFGCDLVSHELTPVAVQTFNVKHFPGTPPGTSNPNYLQHPSRSLEGVFLATAPANSARIYLFLYDNRVAEAPVPSSTDLAVSGPALGATVENQYYVVTLDGQCGQIASFDLKPRNRKPVPRLSNSSSYAVHWNPDSFSDNGLWGHTFSWNPPERTVVTARGPLLFRVTNRGRMPGSTPQVQASVTYSFYAHTPYVKATTITEVRDPLNASAIRNGEIVLDSHLVTHFVWQEKTGELHTIPTLHGPNWQDEWATRVDHDVPWLALTNEPEDYGIGSVIESSLAFSPERGEATTHRPAFYLYYHHFWRIPLTYFTRAWVYPFSDYQRGAILPVDAGSTYVEKMAFLPFYLHAGANRYAEIQAASTAIRNPLIQRWGR